MIRDLFKNKAALNWIKEHDLERILSKMESLLSFVINLKGRLGLGSAKHDFSMWTHKQTSIKLKTVAMSLSYEASGLMGGSYLNTNIDGELMLPSEDVKLLDECKSLVTDITAIFEGALALVPCDALQTLSDLRQVFGLAIMQRMGLSSCTIAEDEVDLRLRDLFDTIDADHSGDISFEELQAAMVEMGVVTSEAGIRQLLSIADEDGSGAISVDEFLVLARTMLKANGIRVIPRGLSDVCMSGWAYRALSAPLPNPDANDRRQQQPYIPDITVILGSSSTRIISLHTPESPSFELQATNDELSNMPASPTGRRLRWSQPRRRGVTDAVVKGLPHLQSLDQLEAGCRSPLRRVTNPLASPLRGVRGLTTSGLTSPMPQRAASPSRRAASDSPGRRAASDSPGRRAASPGRRAASPTRRMRPASSEAPGGGAVLQPQVPFKPSSVSTERWLPVRSMTLMPDLLSSPGLHSPIRGYSHLLTGARALRPWVPRRPQANDIQQMDGDKE
jgi:hypothetical protein